MSEDIFYEIVVNTDGTAEITERELTPEEIEEKYSPAPDLADDDMPTDAVLDILLGYA